jgi:hypothetical protein
MDVILSSVCRKGEGEIIDRPKNKLIIISSPPIPTHTHERWDIGRQEELANLLVCVWDGRRASQCIQYHHKSLSYTSKLRPCTHKPEGCRHSTTHTQELEKRRGESKIGSRILRVNQKLFNALILDQNLEPMRIGRISGHRRRHMEKVSNITTPHTQVNVRPTGGLSIHQSLPPTHTKEEFVLHLFFHPAE